VVSRHSKHLLKIEDDERLLVIAEVWQSSVMPDAEANAHLMATAPELLATLIETREVLAVSLAWPNSSEIRKKIDAVILKAINATL
jgi:hypothetical protein